MGLSLGGIDLNGFWAWFLLWIRLGAMFHMLPGIGTDQAPFIIRGAAAMIIALAAVLAGHPATAPESVPQAGLMIFSEFVLGYILGLIPSMIIQSISVAGQVAAGAIGLAQASMIDLSLGASTTW